ncbi:hypothetical protein NC652_012413 [Populus alba x Populus x berolinensis]|nr:hypothetical protein NC652_012413 [Populus alba x Populus x berolinensis]
MAVTNRDIFCSLFFQLWQLLLAMLLVTRKNDSGAASNACFPLFSKNFSSSTPTLPFSLYLSVFIVGGSESDEALSCHGAGRGGVRQLCTIDRCHCMA